jgi:excisionase family DNA binding protein
MDAANEITPLIRPEALAKILGLSKPRIFQPAESGEIPSIKIGKSTRFEMRDVIEFIRTRKREKRGQ